MPESEATYLAPSLDEGALQLAGVKKVLQGRSVPIPVIWGDLFEKDAPIDGAVKATQIPARKIWTAAPKGKTGRKAKPAKAGCLVILAVILAIVVLV